MLQIEHLYGRIVEARHDFTDEIIMVGVLTADYKIGGVELPTGWEIVSLDDEGIVFVLPQEGGIVERLRELCGQEVLVNFNRPQSDWCVEGTLKESSTDTWSLDSGVYFTTKAVHSIRETIIQLKTNS